MPRIGMRAATVQESGAHEFHVSLSDLRQPRRLLSGWDMRMARRNEIDVPVPVLSGLLLASKMTKEVYSNALGFRG